MAIKTYKTFQKIKPQYSDLGTVLEIEDNSLILKIEKSILLELEKLFK